MTKNKINIKNFEKFWSPLLSEKELLKNPIYKKLKLSKTAFFIYRYLVLSYFNEGIHTFFTPNVLKDIYESETFISILNDTEKEELNIKDLEDGKEIENNEENIVYINTQENSVDRLEFEDKYNNLLIQYIYELSEKGFILIDLEYHQKKDIFNFFSSTFNLALDGLHLINNNFTFSNTLIKRENGYENYKDFLDDGFTYINSKQTYIFKKEILNEASPILINIYNEAKLAEHTFIRNIEKTTIEIPFLIFSEKNKFNKKQEDILLCLLKEHMQQKTLFSLEDNLIRLYYSVGEAVDYNKIFDFADNIIEVDYREQFNNFYVEEKVAYILTEDTLDFLQPDNENESLHKLKDKTKLKHLQNIVKNSPFELVDPEITLDDLILSKKTTEAVEILIKSLDDKVLEKLKKWNFEASINSCILFSGISGTGKTASSYAIAHALGKQLLSFDCSHILSMYIGESEKNVRNIFEKYEEISKETDNPPILLLNEADQFLSSRIEKASSSSENMHNQMQNIFLEQIEKFKGILIATTNLKDNLDKAFSRRFNKKIEFTMPEKEIRNKIWNIKLLNKLPLEENFDFSLLGEYELTGGQIDLVIKNTVLKLAVLDAELFTTADFLESIKEELGQKFDKNKQVGFF